MADEKIRENVLRNIIALTDSIMFLNEQGYEVNQKKWNKLIYLHVLAHSVETSLFDDYIVNMQL